MELRQNTEQVAKPWSSINSTEQRPTNLLITYQPTQQPKRHIQKSSQQKYIHFTKHFGKCTDLFVSLFYTKIFDILISKNAYGVHYIYFLYFKLCCCTPFQIFQSYFLCMKFSVRPNVLYSRL